MLSSQAYNALKIAAERLGANNYRAQLAEHTKAGRLRSTFRFHVTPEHAAIVAAMGNKSMDDHTAMAMLHEYDTMKQRLAG
jgi:hypothetical protein